MEQKRFPWEYSVVTAIIAGVVFFVFQGVMGDPISSGNGVTSTVSHATTSPTPVAITQAEKDRCEIQAEEYARNNAQLQIDESDERLKEMGGTVLTEGDPTKIGTYQPDLKRAYLNCIDNTNY